MLSRRALQLRLTGKATALARIVVNDRKLHGGKSYMEVLGGS